MPQEDEMIDLTKLDDNQITAEINKIKNKRGEIEKELHNLEKQIYNLETSYLQDTHHIGNLVKGWSGYLSSRFVVHLFTIFNEKKN